MGTTGGGTKGRRRLRDGVDKYKAQLQRTQSPLAQRTDDLFLFEVGSCIMIAFVL